MPAEINSFIGRQAAWHKLGKVTGHYLTWEEIQAEGGLDYVVFKAQLFDWRQQAVDAWGTFRLDKPDAVANAFDKAIFLGPVGEDYTVIQHAQGFEMVDELMRSVDGAHYETAGCLGKGEVVWGLADLNLSMHVGRDEHKHYLAFATGHDGSMSHRYWNCNERIVCKNTLMIGLGQASAMFKVRHTKNAQDRINLAHEALATVQDDLMTMEQRLNFLARRRVTKESLQTIMARLFPLTAKTTDDGEKTMVSSTRRDNILGEILNLYESNDNNAFPEFRGTPYNLLNSITNYADHVRGAKGNDGAESAMFGTGARLKLTALDLILEEAGRMPEMLSSQKSTVVDFAAIGLNVPSLAN